MQMLANEIQAAGGVMTAIDLLSAQPEVKAALNSTVTLQPGQLCAGLPS